MELAQGHVQGETGFNSIESSNSGTRMLVILLLNGTFLLILFG